MIKTLLLTAAAALAALLLYATTRPDTFRVERSTFVAAPPERVFPLIVDLHRFNTWNPYVKKDPAIEGRYEGPASGNGAAYGWQSKEVGVGRMQITDNTAPSRVSMALEFIEPFAARNTADFTLQPENGGTRVSWAMHGPVPYLSKLMHLFFNVDRMVGQDFERGLADLKAAAEGR